MIHLLALGALIGVAVGSMRPLRKKQHQADDAGEPGEEGQQQQQQQGLGEQGGPVLPTALQDNPAQMDGTRRSRFSNARIAAAVGGAACLAGAAAAISMLLGKRRNGRSKQHGQRRTDGRIPLKDLIRFKERQWFVEELEQARDADANSMIRLAKMYLNGQGCQRNIAMAQEWVRKARSMGVPATLDELYATDDPDPHTKLRQLAAMEERRRALRQLNGATAKAGHKHVPQPGPTAAA